MIEAIIRNVALFAVEFALTFVVVLWSIARVALTNLQISLPLFAIAALVLLALLVMNFYSWFFVYVWYYLEYLVVTLLNSARVLLLGVDPMVEWFVPLLGQAADVVLAILIAFGNTFCPDKDYYGACLGLDRMEILFVDVVGAITYFVEYSIVQTSVYLTMIQFFICESLLAAGAYSDVPEYCVGVLDRVTRFDAVVANGTFEYISQGVVDDIESVVGVFGSVARWLVRDAVDFVVRTLLFLVTAGMIVSKYFSVASAVVVNMIAWVILGIVYNSNPRLISGNDTAPTFEKTYDDISTMFTEELLLLDPIGFYNSSQYACPATVCETYMMLLENMEYTSYALYSHIMNIFIWIDDGTCSVMHFRDCSEHFGLCDLMFGDKGLLRVLVKYLIQSLTSAVSSICIPAWTIPIINVEVAAVCLPGWMLYWPCYFAPTSKRVECYLDFWMKFPLQVCAVLYSGQNCPCGACAIDPSMQYSLFHLVGAGLSTRHRVPCNPTLPDEDACCLSEADGYYFFDENCFNVSSSGYTSIFYYIYQLQVFGNAQQFIGGEVFRCTPPLGYGYSMQRTELTPRREEYYRSEYPALVREALEEFSGDFPGLYAAVFAMSLEKFAAHYAHSADRPYFYLEWNYITSRVGKDSDMYTYYKGMLYTYTAGCYGPDYVNYYHDLASIYIGDEPGFPAWDTDRRPHADLAFWDAMLALGYGTPPEPDYYMHPAFPSDDLALCPGFLRQMKLLEDPPDDDHIAGNSYYFHYAVSLLRQLRDALLERKIEGALAELGIPTHHRICMPELIWPTPANHIDPGVLLDALSAGTARELLPGIKWIDALEANASFILAYGFQEGFWDYVASEHFCAFYSVENSDPYEADRMYRGYYKRIYPEQKRHSFYNYFMPSAHGPDGWGRYMEYVWLDLCEMLSDRWSLPDAADWAEYEAKFFAGDLDGAAHAFLSRAPAMEPVSEHWDYYLTSDRMETIARHYLVVRVMREKYFAPLFLLKALELFAASDPCSPSLDEVSYFDLSGVAYTQLDCAAELQHLAPFLEYFARHWGDYWYGMWVDVSEWPDNVCSRVSSVETTLRKIDLYYLRSGHFPFDMRYSEGASKERLLAATLLYRFMERLSLNSSEGWFQGIGYDAEAAARFCINVDAQPPRYGVGLPDTPCLLHTAAIAASAAYRAEFLGASATDLSTVKFFLKNVSPHGMSPSEVDSEASNFAGHYRDTPSVLRNSAVQSQTEYDC